MQTLLADIVADADSLLANLRNTIADNLRHNREMIEGGRPLFEAAVNSVFAVVVAAKIKQVPSRELYAHIEESFPIALAGNELGALAKMIAQHYNNHLEDIHGELISHAVGNIGIFAQNLHKLENDPHRYLNLHCQTWAATQPFRVVVTTPAFDALIGGLKLIEQYVRDN